VKIVEGNEIRRDIEEIYLKSSRKPSAVALDFRAQLAGNITARNRIHALISRYGAETVKGVMKKIIDDGERAFLKKLSRLPDGGCRGRAIQGRRKRRFKRIVRLDVAKIGKRRRPYPKAGVRFRSRGAPRCTTAAVFPMK
jgi:N-methylhydantoinase B/oxoprolinase/acetone carboxylase alpha subunit